jgi:hypothetical protein
MLTSIDWPRSPFSTVVGLARLAPDSGRLRLLEQVAKLAPASTNNCWFIFIVGSFGNVYLHPLDVVRVCLSSCVLVLYII